MLAWEIARQCQQTHCQDPFEERVIWHLAHGLVHSEPACLVLASLVSWDGQRKAPAPEGSPINAWFVELASLSGAPLSRIKQVFPYPMPWIVFRRNNGPRLHAYSWNRFWKSVDRTSHPSTLNN